MIQKIVDILINKQLKYQKMENEDVDIYRYGYTLLCEVFLNLIMSIIIGIAFSEITTVILFLGIYIPLRSYCGGWHADKIWKCTIISNLIVVLLMFSIRWFLDYGSVPLYWFIFIISLVFIIYVAPIDTEMKKISKKESNTYKRKILLFMIVHSIMMIQMTIYNLKKFIFLIAYIYILQSVMLLIEIVKRENK